MGSLLVSGFMKKKLIAGMLCGLGCSGAADFQKPQLLEAAGEPIQVESPGYAAPCWEDVDGDGLKDLVVGQFNGGKIQVFRNEGDGKFAKGEWLKADGKAAKVPGVW